MWCEENMYEKFCTFFQTLNNNNLVDEESTTVSPHLKELRIKSTTSVPPFEHDLAATVVSHEINRSAAHYATTTTRPYLSQLRAKCEKKYEKDQHHILKSLEVAKVDHDDKKSQSNKEDTGTDDDLESNDNHIVSLKISKKVQFFFETTFDPKDKINIFWK